ncbi:MAG: hypothetical protein LBQ58_00165 [Synergistaceae bacterium]|jgi:hypothetical protein|nr:hypothetical protein [Synergistaceae bacterium]
MKNGKKLMAALAVVMLLAMASAAIASGESHHGQNKDGWRYEKDRGHMDGRGPGMRDPIRHGGGHGWGPGSSEIPQNIRDKMADAEKLSIVLREMLDRSVIDRGRAMGTYRRHIALRNEIAEWFFERHLDRLTANPRTPGAPPYRPGP